MATSKKKPVKKKKKVEVVPLSWHELQAVLRECTTEDQVAKLMEDEKQGQNRLRWLMRMQGRLRVLRTERENAELAGE